MRSCTAALQTPRADPPDSQRHHLTSIVSAGSGSERRSLPKGVLLSFRFPLKYTFCWKYVASNTWSYNKVIFPVENLLALSIQAGTSQVTTGGWPAARGCGWKGQGTAQRVEGTRDSTFSSRCAVRGRCLQQFPKQVPKHSPRCSQRCPCPAGHGGAARNRHRVRCPIPGSAVPAVPSTVTNPPARSRGSGTPARSSPAGSRGPSAARVAAAAAQPELSAVICGKPARPDQGKSSLITYL